MRGKVIRTWRARGRAACGVVSSASEEGSSFLGFGGLVLVSLGAFVDVDADEGAREGVEGDCDWA